MAKLDEIDYGVLIDRLIPDFLPVRRLWPVRSRLLLWIVLEAAVLALTTLVNGAPNFVGTIRFDSYGAGTAAFIIVSIAASWMALRNSIPGRETGAAELILLPIGIVAAAALTARAEPLTEVVLSSESFRAAMERQLALGALPWVTLFWAVRRATPLRPLLTGAMIGVAASSFAIAAGFFGGPAYPIICELLAGAFFTFLSAAAGAVWLDSARSWRHEGLSAPQPNISMWLGDRVIFSLAAGAALALLFFTLKAGPSSLGRVPDFDLAIENYQLSIKDFRPNVPSASLETVLSAYIELGMPPYMWDFGPQGFKLVGGRFEHLADGTPVTFTWFRGPKAGVICMFRQVNGFKAPPAVYSERQHLLFYRYRGYSVCLMNVGGYGDFVSVIVSPIRMKPFMRVVLNTLSPEQH